MDEAISVPSREETLHWRPCNINPICGGGLASRPAPPEGPSPLPLPAYLPFLDTPLKSLLWLNQKLRWFSTFDSFLFFLSWRFSVVLLISDSEVVLTMPHEYISSASVKRRKQKWLHYFGWSQSELSKTLKKNSFATPHALIVLSWTHTYIINPDKQMPQFTKK